MKNFVQNSKTMEYSNSGSAISSGDVVVIGDRIAIALTDIAATTGKGTVELEGVYELTSDTGTAYAQGDVLFWTGTTLTKTGTANVYAGMCMEAKTSGAAVARVRLQDAPKRADHVADASAGSAAEINALRDALIAAGLMKNA